MTDTPGLVAVFAGPVAVELTHLAHRLGWSTRLLDPDAERLAAASSPDVDETATSVSDLHVDDDTDVVMTDHHRDELGPLLRDLLAAPTRWIGLVGNPRQEGPHLEALRELGVAESEIARVHRPIGLNIGSRTPTEIAVSTMAGLLADRSGRPGGFQFG
ncbi:MAG: XdhC family protein [Actinomycetota bacterium]|nr:XdhC family protein [Actinomycetota bacterium]